MVNSLEHWILETSEKPSERKWVLGDDLSKAVALAGLSAKTESPVFVVCATRAEARNLIDNFDFFSRGKRSVYYLPSIEFDYHRGLLLNPEILCERNVALYHALYSKGVIVTTLTSVLQKVIPPERFKSAVIPLKPNDEVERGDLEDRLVRMGYQRQPTAYDPGIFSIRGGVIDIFCPLYPKPVRLEFYGDLIEEIRYFDPKTQLSQEKLESIAVIPVGLSLVPDRDAISDSFLKIKERLDNLDVPKAKRDDILENIRSGAFQPEYSFLFPYLSFGSNPVFDYLPADTIVIWDGKEKVTELAADPEVPKLQKSHELYEKEPLPIAEYSSLFLDDKSLSAFTQKDTNIFWETFSSGKEEIAFSSQDTMLAPPESGGKNASAMIDSYSKRFRDWMDQGYRIHLVSHTDMHVDRVASLFQPRGLTCLRHPASEKPLDAILKSDFSQLHLWQGFISESRLFPTLKVALLSEEQIFGHKKRVARSSSWNSTDTSKMLSAFRDMQVSDYVVHKDFGIGRYLGLKSMNFQGVENDYVLLEYKDGDKLYIPVYRLNVLQKYVGGEGSSAVLDKLGGDGWAKAKSKARRAAQELAAEFLEIHARRKLIPAFAFTAPGQDFQQFEMEFPFDETPDQLKSIEDVQSDLGKNHPMDRLLCGDVGYGKTEVAMRAAFRAVQDGKQVAILVPTTVLAFQHFENFKKRLQNFGVSIEMVSRLRSPKETKTVLEKLKEGKVDIIVGTHRLLSTDVQFRDLGLLVIDEEHRFGVVHKEKLKKLSESLHVLSMTATPIPRTLNMAMAGIKDISIITTPPPDRLSVRTFVCRKSDEIILEAIQNELARDGQIFFVHNRIETLFGIAEDLKRLMPKLKMEVVHGQMDGETLEKKMLNFYQGTAQVLLTTTIIESGLDIPRANTIIIDKADHLGLAQLYQLRGRVGRSERRAYCYLLVPNENQLTQDAKERLQVIQRYSDLGGGFQIASHDLEIRGAGDLLGKDQSGYLNQVGVDYYFELLEEAIRELRGQEKKIEIEPEINLKISAYFPIDYLPDVGERVQLYRRLSSIDALERVSEIEAEIRDRFGELPEEVTNLLGLMTIKLYLKQLHVVKMTAGPKRTSLQFADSTPASPEKLVKLITADPKNYQITPDHKFVFAAESNDWKTELEAIKQLCESLEIPIP